MIRIKEVTMKHSIPEIFPFALLKYNVITYVIAYEWLIVNNDITIV